MIIIIIFIIYFIYLLLLFIIYIYYVLLLFFYFITSTILCLTLSTILYLVPPLKRLFLLFLFRPVIQAIVSCVRKARLAR